MVDAKKASSRLSTLVGLGIVITIIVLFVQMLASLIQAHNRSHDHERFCLNQGFAEYRELTPINNQEFWCVLDGHSIDPKALGWKGE